MATHLQTHTLLHLHNVNTNTNFVLAYQTQQKSSLKKIVIRRSRAAPSYLLMPLHIYLTLKRTVTKIVTPFPASCQLIHADLTESHRSVLTSNIPEPLAAAFLFFYFFNLHKADSSYADNLKRQSNIQHTKCEKKLLKEKFKGLQPLLCGSYDSDICL